MQYGPEGNGGGAAETRGLTKPLFLIGFMGVGKSSVAALLGERLKVPVHEMDEEIAERVGLSIPEMFRQRGESYFRGVESQMVTRLGGMGPRVISCGGGVPMREENVTNMRSSGWVLLLTARPDTILKRVRHNQNRPLLNGNMNIDYIAELMEQRRERYEAAADAQVSTDGKTTEEICREIIKLIQK